MSPAHLERVRRILFAACTTLRAAPSTHWEDAIAVAADEVAGRAGLLDDRDAYRDAMERYRAARKADGESPKHRICMAAEINVSAELVEQRAVQRGAMGLPLTGSYRGKLMVYLSPHADAVSGEELTADEALDAVAMLRRLGITPDHVAWVGQVEGHRIDTLPLHLGELVVV